ncbi:MAG: hypothetical protein J6S48_00550 [Bacteroidales bacterium]|nr:hypothetical protein [Bacteroidales bacterium]
MKKIFVIIAILAFAFTSCDNGNINGGRYYGTFHNQTNGLREAGSLSFKYVNEEGIIYFMMNDLVPLTQMAENKFAGAAEGATLHDLLEDLPAIDSIKVCEPPVEIRLMSVDAEFMGNSMKANMTFTTTMDEEVAVQFIGYYE